MNFNRIKAFSLLTFLCILMSSGIASAQVKPGTSMETDEIKITFTGRKHNIGAYGKDGRDVNINSPKSVNISQSMGKYFINSLEGGRTVVYDYNTDTCIRVIKHEFTEKDKDLWARPSGLFSFNHYFKNTGTFTGKPVESVLTHDGRYLWVPYYRRSFDINAQDPSAIAVIDTETDSIIRLFETGPLPKMVAASSDGKWLAISHWGDNTVALMSIESDSPKDWSYKKLFVIDHKLNLNFSTTEKVDRDVNSGYCLRGTVFTPDSKYLLVGCMGGSGGIAVIDLQSGEYLGRVMGAMSNLRHLVIDRGWLYVSINNAGYVQKIPLVFFLDAISKLKNKGTVKLDGWENCKVGAGARTIVLSPDGRFIFAACNLSKCIAIVKARTMKLIGTISADPYPVGLDISEDGKRLIMTGQGHSGRGGGNVVDFYEIEYKDKK